MLFTHGHRVFCTGGEKNFPMCIIGGSKMFLGEVMFLASTAWITGGKVDIN